MTEDDQMHEEKRSGSDVSARAGGEFDITRDLCLRCGYNYNQTDPDHSESDDLMKSHTL